MHQWRVLSLEMSQMADNRELHQRVAEQLGRAGYRGHYVVGEIQTFLFVAPASTPPLGDILDEETTREAADCGYFLTDRGEMDLPLQDLNIVRVGTVEDTVPVRALLLGFSYVRLSGHPDHAAEGHQPTAIELHPDGEGRRFWASCGCPSEFLPGQSHALATLANYPNLSPQAREEMVGKIIGLAADFNPEAKGDGAPVHGGDYSHVSIVLGDDGSVSIKTDTAEGP